MKYFLICLTLLMPLGNSAYAEKLKNTLASHPAPYLALHGEDPVAWQVWNEKAIKLAQEQNKILYLSIGYFSCHWCHVMQQESYQNTEIANFLNQHFIPVKVDKELDPALDRRLMDFTQRIIGRGGWPLNVFVTPTGHPIYSLLYAKPEQFLDILKQLQDVWAADPKKMIELVSSEVLEVFPASEPVLDQAEFNRLLSNSVAGVMARADYENGGFGNNQKFPSVPQLQYLLDSLPNDPDPKLDAFLMLTLTAMANQGLHDHLSGGFFRYTTDAKWQIPHFEKMLYDNINLASLYIKAAKVLDKPEFNKIAERTLTFLRTEMWHEDGAFISSFSAVDDKNVEGGSYLWTKKQIGEILDQEQREFAFATWNLNRASELPAGNHLRFKMSPQEYAEQNSLGQEYVTNLYQQTRTKLLESRMQRSLPVDDKLVAGWNGMALSLMVEASRSFPDSGYRATASLLRHFLATQIWKNNQLARSITKGEQLGSASLEDYAYVSRGLLDWAEYAGSQEDLKLALAIVEQGWQKFYKDNGWYQGDDTLLAPTSGQEMISDAATEAPAASLIVTSLRLAKIFSDEPLKNKALSALNRGQDYLARAPFWYVSQLKAISLALAR